MITLLGRTISPITKSNRNKILAFYIAFLLCLLPNVTSTNDSSQSIENLQVEPDDYIEYQISTSVFRQWNYTIVENTIVTHNGTAYYERDVISTISMEINIQNEISDDQYAIIISYYADTAVGYEIDTSFLIYHSFSSGECTIQNGSLAGISGHLHLFEGSNWDLETFFISRLDSINITADFFLSGTNIEIMNEYQEVTTYNCTSYDPVDGNTPHSRSYDSDSGLLLYGSGGFSDAILTGLANITYAVGSIRLVDTSLSLGPSAPDPIVRNSIFIGVVSLGVFIVCYIGVYLSRKRKYKVDRPKKSKHKRKKRRNNP